MAIVFGKFHALISSKSAEANITLSQKEYEFSDVVAYKIIAVGSDGSERIIECHDGEIEWIEVVE